MRTHHLERHPLVHRWNRHLPPRLTVAPGDTVIFDCADSSGGQVFPGQSLEAFQSIDTSLIHALTGPVAIAGAEPGDALVIEILAYEHEGWGWSSLQPGLGLLPDDFSGHYLQHWTVTDEQLRDIPGLVFELAPFCGVLGVQRTEEGEFRTRPPGPFGGNLDVRHLTAGARLVLPVFVAGANFCAGDAHLAQGDGEVCVNGAEAPIKAHLRFSLEKGRAPSHPYALAPNGLTPQRYAEGAYHLFMETDEDLMQAARNATRRAIDYLQTRLNLPAEQAYIACSLALDLRLSQVVNKPRWTVTGHLPEAIFAST